MTHATIPISMSPQKKGYPMKFIPKIFSTAIIFMLSTQCSEVIIRPATETDLNALIHLSHCSYQNHFKPLWQKHYAWLTPSHQTIDEFVNEKEKINNDTNADFIKKQTNDENFSLLVAHMAKTDNTESLVGFCRFEKKSDTNMYIHFILVDESERRQGIAKKLAYAAMHKWDTVTQCNFRALVHYDFINELYSKHNCIKTGTVSLDPNTAKISTDPNAIITHNDYSFAIQK